MGVPANSVVSKALDITDTYCERSVHIDVSSNLIMLSQLRGTEREPLTLIRPVPERVINNMTIQSLQHLIYEIRNGKLDLAAAEEQLEKILKKPRAYPKWVIMMGNAGIATGVSVMFTNNWRIVVLTFLIALMVDRLLYYLYRKGVPPFFRQVAASTFVTLAAAMTFFFAKNGVEFFENMNPTLIVVGGIIMLVSGLAIVGAIQDAIEEFYLTATSRILKVGMLTAGIVIGILIGLYTARKLGIGIAVSPDPLQVNSLPFQIIGGVVVASCYAIATQTHVRAVAIVGMVAGGSLVITHFAREFGISPVPASGIAAAFVGLVAVWLSRFWRTPSSGIIAAGIIPLVPGLALYNGLMQLINYPPGDPLFYRGVGTLFTALAIAISIAGGASFGSMLGRPIHQKTTHRRNFLPFAHFMKRQLRASVNKKTPFYFRQPKD